MFSRFPLLEMSRALAIAVMMSGAFASAQTTGSFRRGILAGAVGAAAIYGGANIAAGPKAKSILHSKACSYAPRPSSITDPVSLTEILCPLTDIADTQHDNPYTQDTFGLNHIPSIPAKVKAILDREPSLAQVHESLANLIREYVYEKEWLQEFADSHNLIAPTPDISDFNRYGAEVDTYLKEAYGAQVVHNAEYVVRFASLLENFSSTGEAHTYRGIFLGNLRETTRRVKTLALNLLAHAHVRAQLME